MTPHRPPAPGPRDHRCPTCHAVPGDPCRSPQPHKVTHSHTGRQDQMIRAQWTPPTFSAWLTQQLNRHDPIGDLARALRADLRSGCLHPAPRTPTAARRHLQQQHDVASAALTALDRAEREHSEAVRQWRS